MSVVCAILVVTIHVYWPHDGCFSFTWLVYQFIQEGLARIAVPFFFVVSGFFLSKHMSDRGWYVTEVKKRYYSLVVPFVVWTVISIVCIVPIQIVADILANRPFGYTPAFSNGRWIVTLGLDPCHGPKNIVVLWYVRCLFSFVLLAPIFKWLVRKGNLVWLAFAFALTVVHSSWPLLPPFFQAFGGHGFSLSGVFYFSTGIYIGLSKTMNLSKAHILICSMIGVSLLLVKTIFSSYGIGYHVNYLTIAIPFLLCAVWHLMPSSKWPSALTSCSFPIFLLHFLCIPIVSIPIKHSMLRGSQFGSVLIFLCATFLSICLASILRKFPRINAFLFAGRS